MTHLLRSSSRRGQNIGRSEISHLGRSMNMSNEFGHSFSREWNKGLGFDGLKKGDLASKFENNNKIGAKVHFDPDARKNSE